MKNSRAAGFIIIFAGYFTAVLAGIAAFNLIGGALAVRVFVSDVAATLVIYILSLIFNNASFYDPYWSVQPPVILMLLALYFGKAEPGIIIVICAVFVWAARLTANWAYTFKNLSSMDWRYSMLKEKSGRMYFLVNLFGIQLFPTCIVFLCILPAIRFIESGGGFGILTLAGAALCVFSAVLQLVSDMQMHKFRKKCTGGLIETGLWRYSRHPNYLGEIIMWWGVYISVLASQAGLWPLFPGALANTLMFIFISIPMAEKRQSVKPGFDEYKRETRMLLPVKIKRGESRSISV